MTILLDFDRPSHGRRLQSASGWRRRLGAVRDSEYAQQERWKEYLWPHTASASFPRMSEPAEAATLRENFDLLVRCEVEIRRLVCGNRKGALGSAHVDVWEICCFAELASG